MVPPFHPNCRTVLVPVGEVQVEPVAPEPAPLDITDLDVLTPEEVAVAEGLSPTEAFDAVHTFESHREAFANSNVFDAAPEIISDVEDVLEFADGTVVSGDEVVTIGAQAIVEDGKIVGWRS